MHRSGATRTRLGHVLHLVRYGLIATAVSAALSLTTACIYGFTGGGLPSHIKTIAVLPFDNETPVADLQREISDSLRARLAQRLGLRDAPVNKASALVRGTIHRYEADIPVGYSANTRAATTARRALQMNLDIDVLDQVTGKTLWSRKNYVVDAQYEERAEKAGRSQAIDRIVNAIVEGAQSQW